MTLEADGIIDVWEIETGKVIAQYEGLEVHEDMQSIPDMKQRIAELEQTVTEATERISYLNTTNSMRRTTIEEQTARIAELEAKVRELEGALTFGRETIARLEQDNRRLRHLDAMPVDAIRRLHDNTTYSHEYAPTDGYSIPQYDEDCAVVNEWLATLDGDA